MICLKRWQARGGFGGLLKDTHCGQGNTSASSFTSCPQYNSSGIQKSPQRFSSHCSGLPSQIPVLGEQGIQMRSSCDAQMLQKPHSLSSTLSDWGLEMEKAKLCQKALYLTLPNCLPQVHENPSWLKGLFYPVSATHTARPQSPLRKVTLGVIQSPGSSGKHLSCRNTWERLLQSPAEFSNQKPLRTGPSSGLESGKHLPYSHTLQMTCKIWLQGLTLP